MSDTRSIHFPPMADPPSGPAQTARPRRGMASLLSREKDGDKPRKSGIHAYADALNASGTIESLLAQLRRPGAERHGILQACLSQARKIQADLEELIAQEEGS
jgi:hypothetical protein